METRFHSLNNYRRFSAIVWFWNLLDLANLFWLKILLLPIGVWSLGWLVGTCCLWGRFEILYSYVNGALRLKTYHPSWILWCLKSSSTVKNESLHFLHLYLSRLLYAFLRCLKISICVPNHSVQLSSLQCYCCNLLALWTSCTCSSMLLTLRNFL